MTNIVNDVRMQHAQHWAEEQLGTIESWEVLPQDASQRRYFRLTSRNISYIVMDAPPSEPVEPFIRVANALLAQGIFVPEIYAQAPNDGLLLLSDLGKQKFSQEINDNNRQVHYQQALKALIKIHQSPIPGLKNFDAGVMLQELERFEAYFLDQHCHWQRTPATDHLRKNSYQLLVQEISMQPSVTLHRDYHADNLMLCGDEVGVLDFQSAQKGPLVYDAVSLLRDSRVDLPAKETHALVAFFREQAMEGGLVNQISQEAFWRWVDWTGVQLHLKILGIFARLAHRDGKTHYLQHIPRILNYIDSATRPYPELKPIHDCLSRAVP